MATPPISEQENGKRRKTRSKSNNRIYSNPKPKTLSLGNLPDVSPGNPISGKKALDRPSSMQPQEVEIDESALEEVLGWVDKLVVYTLWTSEILYIVISAWTHRLVEEKQEHEHTGRQAHDNIWHDALLTSTICAVVLVVGLLGDFFGHRFLILISGLSIFSLSPAVGILSLHIAGMPYALLWLKVFWYATVPCRLWLIFHQKFPLPVHDTHRLVTVNELLIEISEWLSVVFVEDSKVDFSYSSYLTAWMLALCAAIGYSVATYFIKNFVNQQPSDIEFVRGVYRTTEVVDSFENRQAKVSVMVFFLILYSGGIFTVVKEYFTVSILQLSRKVHYPSFGGVVQYRLDLIVSVFTMLLVEIQLSLMKILRDEMKDLVLIAIAHVVNVVVLVLLLIVVSKSERGYLATEELNFGSLEFYYPAHYHPFFLQCDGEIIKSSKNLTIGFGLVVDGRRDVVCRGWISDDDILFAENVTIRENMRTVYLIRKPALVKVDSFKSWEPVPVTSIVLMNAVDFCTAENNKLNLSYLCSSQSVCLTPQLEMIARSAQNETLLAQELDFPPVNKTSDFIALPQLTVEIEIRYNHTIMELKNLMKVENGKFEKPLSWPLQSSWSIGPDSTVIVLFFFTIPRISCLPMVVSIFLKTYYPDTEMIAPSVLMGIAWGVAAVGYTHFMWTQSPVQWRTSIIAVYTMQHFLFAWLARTWLFVNVTNATLVLVIQCISSLVHVAFTYWFNQRLPPVQHGQTERKGGRRF